MDDLELLWEYGRSGSNDAFARVATRYLDLIYSAALRQVRDPHVAEDITQAVLIILMKKASTLPAGTVLGGWLLKVTRYTALDALKMAGRRHVHERAAARLRSEATAPPDEPPWAEVSPHVDEAMLRLSVADRDAIVLRFLLGKSPEEVAWMMGIGEDAARKRVSRAIHRLRAMLGRRGITAGETALGSVLAANAIMPAPAQVSSLAGSIAAPASGALSTPPTLLARGALRRMRPSPVKWVVLGSTVTVSIVVLAMAPWRRLLEPVPRPRPSPVPVQRVKTVPRLSQSAAQNNLAAVRACIAAGDRIDQLSTDGNGATALVYAAFHGNDAAYEVIRFLLDRGADVNARHAGGYTALMLSVRHRSPRTVELLLERGADVSVQTRRGESALDWARQQNDAKILKLIQDAAAKQQSK